MTVTPRQSDPSAADAAATAAASSELRRLRRTAFGLALAIALLGAAWETLLAPLRPGGSMLVLKVLPLVLALPLLRHGHVRTFQWWSMLILFYLCEGVVRGMSDAGLSATLGWMEAVLAAAAFAAIIAYIREARRLSASGSSGLAA
jgi:uncharacterized membrane protein